MKILNRMVLVLMLVTAQSSESLTPGLMNALASLIGGPMTLPRPTPTIQQQPQTTAVVATTVKIRKTVESDLSQVAVFLSTAAVAAAATSLPPQQQPQSPSSSTKSQMNLQNLQWWCRQRLDQMWAKADIEAMLKRRCKILNHGHRAFARVRLQSAAVDDDAMASTTTAQPQQQQQQLLLQKVWSTSDAWRNEIASAARETGEDSVWKHHNVILTPHSMPWLHHLQMTAVRCVDTRNINSVDDDKAKRDPSRTVVGFCELAMLSNPVANVNDNGVIAVAAAKDDSSSTTNCYSLAVANLAVSPQARRQKIAQKLLQSAERYARVHFRAPSLGLYVDPTNVAALALYQRCNYTLAAHIGGGDGGDIHNTTAATTTTANAPIRLWYMTKSLER